MRKHYLPYSTVNGDSKLQKTMPYCQATVGRDVGFKKQKQTKNQPIQSLLLTSSPPYNNTPDLLPYNFKGSCSPWPPYTDLSYKPSAFLSQPHRLNPAENSHSFCLIHLFNLQSHCDVTSSSTSTLKSFWKVTE